MKKTPITLLIMDGYGLGPPDAGNAVHHAQTPVLDRLFASCPHTTLSASGLDVGLPEGQMGNSEVGHTNVGAGRVVYQDLPRISQAIKSGVFNENPAYNAAIDHCLQNGTTLHIMGLVSDGGVHSHNTHFYAMLRLCARKGLKRVFVHCFLDGRDVPPTSGAAFVRDMQDQCRQWGGKIATVMGRFYAMDRDNRWERVSRAYNAMVLGEAPFRFDAAAAVEASYEADVTDEFMEPVICDRDAVIKENDAVIFMNFRPDRAREITRAFVDPGFSGFDRANGFFPVHFVCTTQYDATMPGVRLAFEPEELTMTFGEHISKLGMTQLRIAETEKYAHVTFFFNGGQETVYPGEDRVLIPSPKVATYDLQPEMSAPEVAAEAAQRILSGKYDVVIINFANCDMVGHTGSLPAAIQAVETVDACVGAVLEAMGEAGGITLLTADHGNADRMLEDDGVSPFTAHTINDVPLILVGAGVALRPGRLCDIAPTMLDIMGYEKPPEMTGKSLIVKA